MMCFSLYGSGGRDDAKVSIPTTVILRYMFTLAEIRVGVYLVLRVFWIQLSP